MCRGLTWGRQPIAELKEVARCLGGKGLAAILEMFAVDHESWTAGMPDLVLWRPEDGRCMLSEVKSPRDRLSEQQRAWILSMEAAGITVEVCRVLTLAEAPPGLELGPGGSGGVRVMAVKDEAEEEGGGAGPGEAQGVDADMDPDRERKGPGEHEHESDSGGEGEGDGPVVEIDN